MAIVHANKLHKYHPHTQINSILIECLQNDICWQKSWKLYF